VKPGVAKRLSAGREQHAIGRHREVANHRPVGQTPNQVRQVSPQQRFTAGQANLVDAKTREHVHERLDLLEVQDVLTRQPHVVRLRHAIAAAQIAAIGDRKTEVPERSVEAIDYH
jgi:hypothetical protein